ncbi:amino acid ABC transporter [Kaistia sp. 32K]|uniref:transporter substrate-binding domain-containing protein n=1 Tax=Kaistia sp. 32K TaxID=2795690 RepID=UPI0019169E9B|nr:transporter substrate-binding domain-containing protein [Kaistia sp. 32K]BCP53295.1 amino acid ABC transporter [Kaistia sp. 32K]
MRIVKQAAIAALALMAVTGAVQAKEWKNIRIAVEGAFPPFNYVGADNQIGGFDVEIAKAVCNQLKAECTFAVQDWDGLIPALQAGKFDAIFSSMSITDERKKVIDFSRPYYQSPSSFIAPKSAAIKDTSPESLKGKTIGAQSSTVQATELEEKYKGSDVKLYPTQDEVNLDLVSGRIDMLFVDKLPGLDWLKTADGANFEFVGTDLPTDGVGAGVRQADSDLRDQISAAIVAIKADGTYDKINAKYFPFSIWKD